MNADDNHDTGEDFDSDEDTRPSGWKRKFAEDDNDYTPPGGHSKNYTPGGRTKNHSGKRDRKRKRGLSVTTSNSISESHKKLRKSLLIPRNEISEPVVKLVENNSDSGLKKKKLAERDSHSPLFEKKKSVERDTPGNPLLILRNELSEPVVKSVENNNDSRLKKKKIDERDSHSPQFEKKKSVERDTPKNPLLILRNELSEPVVNLVENNSDSRLKKKKIDERDSHSPQFEKKKSVERDTPGNPLLNPRNEKSKPVVKSVENNSDSRLKKKKKIDERDSHSPQFEKKKSVERDTPGNPLPIHMKVKLS